MDTDVQQVNQDSVRGFLHRPIGAASDAVVLSHGAGSDSKSRLLVVVADALCRAGFVVLRYDLPFVRSVPTGRLCRDARRETETACGRQSTSFGNWEPVDRAGRSLLRGPSIEHACG